MKRLLCLAALVAFPAIAASPEPPNPPVPPYILTIQEIPERGGVIPCPTTSPNCSADILSTLEITPNLANVPLHAASGQPATETTDEALDSQRRARLNQALSALSESLALSRQINLRKAAGETSLTLDPLSTRFAQLRITLNEGITGYLALDPANRGVAPERTEGFKQAFASPSATGTWLAAQITALDQRAAARVAAATDQGLKLRLAASRVRGGTPPMPVHLPGYDTYDPLSPAAIRRIDFNVSDAERARNAAEVQATAAIVTLIRTNFKELIDAYKKQLDDAKAKVDGALNAIRNADVSSQDLNVSFTAVITQLNTLANGANEPLKTQLAKTATDMTTLQTTVQTTITALATAQTSLANVPSKLDSSALNVAANRPDLVLNNVLQLASGTLTDVTAAIKALNDARSSLDSQLTAVNDDLKQLAASAPAEAPALVARIRSQLLAAIVGPINQLQATKLVIAALGGSEGTTSAQTAGPVVDINAPQVLTVATPMPTQLEITRADPADGDVLDIAAQVLDASNTVVYEENRSVTIRFYGWHSGLASGLVFVRAQQTSQENLKPEAAAIWRVIRTPRPWEDDWRHWYYKMRPAVGLHSTTLHFGNDNNSVQFGLGVSVHFFDDLLQVGYGWNLGVNTNRGYGYVGLGIMKILRNQLPGASKQ